MEFARAFAVAVGKGQTRTPLKPVLRFVTELASRKGTFEFHAMPDIGHTTRTAQDITDILLPGIAFLHKQFAPG